MIAVATLLVAVVGATFAYFTATTATQGTPENKSSVETTKLANIKLTATETSKSTNTVWPGTMNYVGVSVAASVEGENPDEKEYTVTYDIVGKVSTEVEGTFNNQIKYRLYEVNEAISGSGVSDVVNCEKVVPVEDGTTLQYSQTCTENSKLEEGEKVAEGILNSGEETIEVKAEDKTINTGETKYYYLVVEYTNNAGGPQNEDQGKKINIELTTITAKSTVEKSISP